MKAPVQIVDRGSGATERERELVAAGRAVAMPRSDRERVWASIAAACVATEAGIAAAAGAAAGSAGTAPGSVLSVLASWKGVALVAVFGGGVATYHMTRPRPVEPRPLSAPVARHPAAIPTMPRAEPAPQPEALPPVPATTVVKTPAPSHAPAAHTSRPAGVSGEQPDDTARIGTSRLAEESRAVIAARRALRDGDPAACLRLLEAARTAFPDGSLAQEREALTIQALASDGQHELAAQRAARFLREHPESPHAADLRRIAR